MSEQLKVLPTFPVSQLYYNNTRPKIIYHLAEFELVAFLVLFLQLVYLLL